MIEPPSVVAARSESNAPHRLILIMVLLLAIGIRFQGLDKQSFWYDEAVQLDIASHPVSYILGMKYDQDVLPPASYLLLHVWIKFGQTDFWIRALSACFGIAGVGGIYLLGRDLFNRSIALLASFIAAVNPFHVWYSQDARPYTLMMLFCTMHVWFFLRCIRSSSWGNWIGFAVFAALALNNHPLAILTLGLEFIYASFQVRKASFWKKYLVAGGLALLSLAPFVLIKFLHSPGNLSGYTKPVSWMVLPFGLYSWLFGFSIGPSINELHWHLSPKAYLSYLPLMIPMLIAVSLSSYGIIKVISNKCPTKSRLMMLLVWMTTVVFSVFLIAKAGKTTFNVRYCSEAFLPFALLMACGLESLFTSRLKGALCLILILTGSGISLLRMQGMQRYWKEDIRGAMNLINSRSGSTDTVVLLETTTASRYSSGKHSLVAIKDVLAEDGTIHFPLVSDNTQRWLVYYREWMCDPEHRLKTAFDSTYTPAGTFSFPNCQVFRYQIAAP